MLNAMEYVTLRNTNLSVSRFCMGGCPMGMYGWGETYEKDFLAAIDAALELGVNFFDTADTYGLGQSERILAKGLGRRRKDVVIQSKFGVNVESGKTEIVNAPEYLRRALDASLKRLNADCIDIYVVHYWDNVTPPDEIVAELERQRDAGKIRYFGLSNLTAEQLPNWAPFRSKFATIQSQFSLACRDHEDALRSVSETLDATIMTWGSLGQGVLTGKYGQDVVFPENDRRSRDAYVNFHGEKLLKNLEIVNQTRKVAASHGKTLSQVAIRFILDFFKDSVAIVGIKSPSQAIDCANSVGWRLSVEDLRQLDLISRAGS